MYLKSQESHKRAFLDITQHLVKEGYLLGSILQWWMWTDNLLHCACALFYTPTKPVQLSQVKKNSNIFIRNKNFQFVSLFHLNFSFVQSSNNPLLC